VNPPRRIWTVGHSTLAQSEFLALLAAHGIQMLADVRRFPSSRRHPHFNRDAMEKFLAQAGIRYLHLPQLGGRRDPLPDSPNTGWREPGFRGYADHMHSTEFLTAVAGLDDEARGMRTALMCAEKDWRDCHRGLIADYLKCAGVEVLHIVDTSRTEPHPWTGPARLVDGRVSYAADPQPQGTLF
jgi:uncharacterized protein (DUF488 family)